MCFMYVLRDTEPSPGNRDCKKWLSLSVCMLGLMKSGQPRSNMAGQAVRGKCRKLGEALQRLFVRILRGLSVSSEKRLLPSSGCREGPSHVRVCYLLQKRRAGGRSEGPSCFCHFLKLFQLNIVSKLRYHVLGIAYPETHHLPWCFWKVPSLIKGKRPCPTSSSIVTCL